MYRIRNHLKEINNESYAHGVVDIGPDGLDCSLGINPYGFSENVLAAARNLDRDAISQYPHGNIKFKNSIIGHWKGFADLDPDRIELAGGSIDCITKVNRMFIDKGSRVLGHVPQFPDYGIDVEVMGGIYDGVEMIKNGGRFDGDAFADRLDERYAACYIDNPNNPTGQIIPVEEIADICEKAARLGVCVLVDEAYGDFMEKSNSAATLLNRFDNLLVLRSFSKGFGLAGLRVGYILGAKALMEIYQKVAIPFAVSGPGEILAEAALKDEAFLAESRAKIEVAKRKIMKEPGILSLMETGMTTPIMTMAHPDKDVDLYGEFLKKRVLTVPGGNFKGLGPHCVRLRIHSEVDALIERIKQI